MASSTISTNGSSNAAPGHRAGGFLEKAGADSAGSVSGASLEQRGLEHVSASPKKAISSQPVTSSLFPGP